MYAHTLIHPDVLRDGRSYCTPISVQYLSHFSLLFLSRLIIKLMGFRTDQQVPTLRQSFISAAENYYQFVMRQHTC